MSEAAVERARQAEEARELFAKRAHGLAEKTANAMEMARNSLRTAAGLADRVDGYLTQVGRDLDSLPEVARQVRSAEVPRPHFHNAQAYGDEINGRLQYAQTAVAEVGELMNRFR